MKNYLKSFILFLVLVLGNIVLPKEAKAYTPFYEMNAPTHRCSLQNLLGGYVDAATGAFTYRVECGVINNPGLSTYAGINFSTQDASIGPFGIGTSCPYDWFVVRSSAWPGSPYTVVGPNNIQLVFDTLSNGIYTDIRDGVVLGATLSFTGQPTGVLCSLTFKNGLIYRFDTYGGLITQVDRYGNTVNITRNSMNGFTSAVTFSNKSGNNSYRWIRYNQDSGNNHVTSIVLQWSYGGTKNTWNISYDTGTPTGKIAMISDPGYSDSSSPSYLKTSGFTWASYTRSDGKVLPLLATITNTRGYRAVYAQYDTATGRVTSLTNSREGADTFSWSTGIGIDGVVTHVCTTGCSFSTTYTWNPYKFGYKTTRVVDNLMGGATTIAYNAPPTYLPTSITDYLNRTTSYIWNTTYGDLVSRTTPRDLGVGTATCSMSHDPKYHILTSGTDPTGRTTNWGVDSLGNIISYTDPTGAIVKMTYDSNGSLITSVDPLNNTRTLYRDTNGTVTYYADPAGNNIQYTVNDTGRTIHALPPTNLPTDLSYDSMHNIKRIDDWPSGVSGSGTDYYTTFAYDASGNLLSATDVTGHTWGWTYDGNNNRTSETNPLGKIRRWDWTNAGLISKYTDFVGNSVESSYLTGGILDHVTYRRANQTVESTITCNYDSTTHFISSLVDSVGGTTTFQYNPLGLVKSITDPNGVTITRLYDILTRPTQMQVVGQTAEVYTYNTKGLMDTITQGSQVIRLTYDPMGRLINQTLPNGVTTTREYNTVGRVDMMSSVKNGVVLDSTTYQYDGAGRPVSITNNGITNTMYYNGLGGKVSSRDDAIGHAYGFNYNSVGLMSLYTLNGALTQFFYDNANHLTAFGNNPIRSITRDDNGSVTAYNGRTYTWNVRGQLVGYTNGIDTFTFIYDALGNRIRVTKNGVITTIAYDGISPVLRTTNGISTYIQSNTPFGAPMQVGSVYSSTTGDGSTSKITDASGNVVGTATYNPFGYPTTTGTTTQFGYTGRYQPDSTLALANGSGVSTEWGQNIGGVEMGPSGPTRLFDISTTAEATSKLPDDESEYSGTGLTAGGSFVGAINQMVDDFNRGATETNSPGNSWDMPALSTEGPDYRRSRPSINTRPTAVDPARIRENQPQQPPIRMTIMPVPTRPTKLIVLGLRRPMENLANACERLHGDMWPFMNTIGNTRMRKFVDGTIAGNWAVTVAAMEEADQIAIITDGMDPIRLVAKEGVLNPDYFHLYGNFTDCEHAAAFDIYGNKIVWVGGADPNTETNGGYPAETR